MITQSADHLQSLWQNSSNLSFHQSGPVLWQATIPLKTTAFSQKSSTRVLFFTILKVRFSFNSGTRSLMRCKTWRLTVQGSAATTRYCLLCRTFGMFHALANIWGIIERLCAGCCVSHTGDSCFGKSTAVSCSRLNTQLCTSTSTSPCEKSSYKTINHILFLDSWWIW